MRDLQNEKSVAKTMRINVLESYPSTCFARYLKVLGSLLILTLSIANIKAQNQQTEFVNFIREQLSAHVDKIPVEKETQNLCTAISKKYHITHFPSSHKELIGKIITLSKKQQVPPGLAPISNHLYSHAIASTFYTSGKQLKAKDWGCEQAKAQLNSLLRKLPAAVNDFLNCIKKFGWGDAAKIYDKITTIDGFLANRPDPNDPNYKHLDCKEELKRLRSLKQEIASLSDKCN